MDSDIPYLQTMARATLVAYRAWMSVPLAQTASAHRWCIRHLKEGARRHTFKEGTVAGIAYSCVHTSATVATAESINSEKAQ